ncbi:MAG: 50S ribosomal protein L6 [Elusimicrobiota bacterium]
MSRVGRKEIVIPKDIKVEIKDKVIISKGNNTLTVAIHPTVSVAKEGDNIIKVTCNNAEKKTRAMQGMTRNLIANSIKGMETPFKKELIIKGIGFKAQVSGKNLVLTVGYSHVVNFAIPEGINIAVDGKANQLIITGINKAVVGEIASQIRRVRPPEPYKATGIAYIDEHIRRKAGKAAASAKK